MDSGVVIALIGTVAGGLLGYVFGRVMEGVRQRIAHQELDSVAEPDELIEIIKDDPTYGRDYAFSDDDRPRRGRRGNKERVSAA